MVSTVFVKLFLRSELKREAEGLRAIAFTENRDCTMDNSLLIIWKYALDVNIESYRMSITISPPNVNIWWISTFSSKSIAVTWNFFYMRHGDLNLKLGLSFFTWIYIIYIYAVLHLQSRFSTEKHTSNSKLKSEYFTGGKFQVTTINTDLSEI